MLGLRAFSDLTTPPDPFGPAGHLLALVGLFGVYPVVVDRWPTLTRAAGGVAAVALVSWGVMTGTRLLAMFGTVGSDLLPGAFVGLMFFSTVLAYVLFGVATARGSEWPWSVGLLVSAPGGLLFVVLVASAVTGVAALEGFVISVGLALAMVSLGYALRTGGAGTGRAERTDDLPVG